MQTSKADRLTQRLRRRIKHEPARRGDPRMDTGIGRKPVPRTRGALDCHAAGLVDWPVKAPEAAEPAMPPRCISRSTNFWTLPVGVCGSRSEK
jgi:hypothetical protein